MIFTALEMIFTALEIVFTPFEMIFTEGPGSVQRTVSVVSNDKLENWAMLKRGYRMLEMLGWLRKQAVLKIT